MESISKTDLEQLFSQVQPPITINFIHSGTNITRGQQVDITRGEEIERMKLEYLTMEERMMREKK